MKASVMVGMVSLAGKLFAGRTFIRITIPAVRILRVFGALPSNMGSVRSSRAGEWPIPAEERNRAQTLRAVRTTPNDDPNPSERLAHRHVRSSERRLDVASVPVVKLQADLQRADRDDPLAGLVAPDLEPGAQRHRAAG